MNTAKSWLIYSYETTPDSIPDIGQYLVRGQLTNPTTLTFDRSNTGTVGLTLTWYLVEFTDASTVQSGSQAFLGADTFLGPLFFGLGVGGSGNWSLYLLLGAP